MDFSSLDYSASSLFIAICLFAAQTIFSLFAGKNCQHKPSSIYFSLPCLFLLLASFFGWGRDIYFQAPSYFCFGPVRIQQHVDSLACVYIGLLGFIGLNVSLFSPGYLQHLKDRMNSGFYWSALSMFMLALALVISSANAIVFLVFWEMMSLSSFALVSSEHKHHRVQLASFIYLGATRIATAFLMGGFLWMYALTGSWNFAQWNSPHALVPALLILIGLCIKAGIWPFHIWLPYAYPAAPASATALMSSCMSKVALYAMIRILVMNDLSSPIIGHVMLALGLVSAVWGVLFALVESELKRLLAFSSVENVGLILMGIGVSLLMRNSHFHELSIIALTAAIFHCVSHGLIKSLLFLAAGSIHSSVHSTDLNKLGGLGKKMPWTMATFIIGSAAICSLPPLNGFVSKWLLYQGLLQTAWQSESVIERSLSLLSIGSLAMVGGLALATFTKAVGVAFLGNARATFTAEHAHEGTVGMKFAQAILGAACILVGLCGSVICGQLQIVSSTALKLGGASASVFNLPLMTFAGLSLVIFLAVYTLLLKQSAVKKFITWECGFGDLSPRSQATSGSFSHPLARIFGTILRYKLLVEITGADRRNFPEHIKVEPQMVSVLETLVYLPTLSWIQNLARAFAKLQAGSIHLYLLYVCITLVLLIFVGTRL